MATKKLVPRATNEGGLGTALKVWGPSWLQNLTITNLQTSTSSSVLVETSGNVEKRAASSFIPNLQSKDEGVNLTTTTESIDYVGAGVTATVAGNHTTVTIPGNCVLDTEDSTTFVSLWDTKTGCQDPKSDGGIRYDALNNILKVGDEVGNNKVWIKNNKVNKFLGNFEVKSQNSHLILWGNGGKIGFMGLFGSNIATMYTNQGLRLHHLNTESAPTYVLTEGISTGATTTPYSTMGDGFVTKTPITSLVPNLQALDEGVSLTTTTQSFDFVGAGVTATNVGNAVTVTITGSPSNVLDTEDATCFISMYESATGALDPKTDEGLLYDALNDHLQIHGALSMGAVNTSTTKAIQRAATGLNAAGGILSLHGGNVVAGAGNDLAGGAVNIWAGAGTGAASAGGSDSYIAFYTYKDVASGSTSQTSQMSHTFLADSQNRFTIYAQDSASNFFNISVDANAETTISTIDSAAANGNIWIKPDAKLYLEPFSNTTVHGRTSGDSYFIQRQNGANLPGGNFWLMGADALGNYTGAGTATGGSLNYFAGRGTGTGPNGMHLWWLSYIDPGLGLGVQQTAVLSMMHSTDNDHNGILALNSTNGNMGLRFEAGQDRGRIYTPTAGKTLELGAKTADGSAIKFQDHTTTIYGDTLATVKSLRIESFTMACSDETTALTTGTGKVTFRMPYAFTITDIRASLTTAGTGANLVTVDVNNGGSTILTNKVTLDATEKTSTTAATAFSFTAAAAALLADDAEISIDIDQIDSGGVSAGLKVSIIGYKTV